MTSSVPEMARHSIVVKVWRQRRALVCARVQADHNPRTLPSLPLPPSPTPQVGRSTRAGRHHDLLKDDLVLESVLGQGTFGKVYKGEGGV